MPRGKRGASLIEVLLALVIITLAAISALSFFAYGMGAIARQGNRRAALERARERLEQVMAANINNVSPSNGNPHWLSCSGNPCNWNLSPDPVFEQVTVNDLTGQSMETTAQLKDDPTAGTDTLDVVEFGVRVWFTPGLADDDYHRVYLRALRAAP